MHEGSEEVSQRINDVERPTVAGQSPRESMTHHNAHDETEARARPGGSSLSASYLDRITRK